MAHSSILIACLCSVTTTWAYRESSTELVEGSSSDTVDEMQESNRMTGKPPIWKQLEQKKVSLRYGANAPPRFFEKTPTVGTRPGSGWGMMTGSELTEMPVEDARIVVDISCNVMELYGWKWKKGTKYSFGQWVNHKKSETPQVQLVWNLKESNKKNTRERTATAERYDSKASGLRIIEGEKLGSGNQMKIQIDSNNVHRRQYIANTNKHVGQYLAGQCGYEIRVLPTPGGVAEGMKEFVLGKGQFQKNEFPGVTDTWGTNQYHGWKTLAMEFEQTCEECPGWDLCSCGKTGVLLMDLQHLRYKTSDWYNHWDVNIKQLALYL